MPEELTPEQILERANVHDPMSVAELAYSQLDTFFQMIHEQPQGDSALNTFAEQLQALAVRLIRMSVYLEERAFWGNSHQAAVKKQNRIASQVRKVLGFSYYKQEINF